MGFALAGLVGAFAVFATVRRRQRRLGYEAWRRRWREVDRERRRRIARSIRRGEAVADPRDAPLAIELIDAQRKLSAGGERRGGWWRPVHYALLAFVPISIALTTGDLKVAALTLLPLAQLLALHVYVRRLKTRIAAAREKNERLSGQLS